MTAPVRVAEVELSRQVPALRAGPGERHYRRARVLARWHTRPVALVDIALNAGELPGLALESALRACTGPLEDTGYEDGRARVLAEAPAATVIVCTRDRASRLAACLAAATAQEYPAYEVVVVDNAATDTSTRELVTGRRWPVPVRYVAEPRPGLSWARNAGLAAASGQIVAYLDDDEWPDRHWLAELARGFTLAPGVAGVSGLVLPAALDTPAQLAFETFGGHSKGRGFEPAIFDRDSHDRQHPLYPLPPFGVGASMAFDRDALAGIGGFDVALGAGTPAQAAEDTAAISDLMLGGATFVYWPGAIMWHQHRREIAELERQLWGYGTGLGGYYLRAVLREPRHTITLARLAPRAIRDMRAGHAEAGDGPGLPPGVTRAMRRGMLAGPARYLYSRRLQARLAAPPGGPA